MSTNEDNYCRECGCELAPHKINSYDPKTGKQLESKHCTNLQCKEGCEHAGHQWGSIFKLQHETCKRCGHVAFRGY